jgi:hypothetical protein
MEKQDRLARTSPAFRRALALVRQMPDCGMVFVPVDPTIRMAMAGSRVGRMRAVTAVAVWRAMLRAATE